MLQKKALFLVTAENEIQPLVNFAGIFKKKYDVEIDVIYIKDVLKYEVFPVSIEGMGLNIGANYAFKEYRELEEKTVKKGDFIDITPGTVHASLKGSILFAEVQQNSDVTYRIYDFDRIDENGKKRELHLQDSADVIDFGKEVVIKNTDFDDSENGKDILRKHIIKKEYYSIDKVKFADSFEDVNNESMTIYSVLEGEGKIVWGKNEELAIKKGETVLIPVGINTKTIGNFEILRTVI